LLRVLQLGHTLDVGFDVGLPRVAGCEDLDVRPGVASRMSDVIAVTDGPRTGCSAPPVFLGLRL
jgi:hypothetical protein